MNPLDDAYANAAYIPDADAYPPRWQREAKAFREALGARAELDVAYGSTDRQVIDFFHAQGLAKGTLVFVHGGYWKAFDHRSWSHLADGALAKGWSVAMPGYDLCPDLRISEITQQIAKAIELIASRTEGPIALTGHSAGGHLVSRMLAPGVLANAVHQRIQRVAPISPVADLLPLLETTMNDVLGLDAVEARAESPVYAPTPQAAVEVWVGGAERPVFLEQANRLATAWSVPVVVVPKKHHFDIIEALSDQESDLVRFLTNASGH